MMGRTILGGLKILSVGSKTFTRFWKKTFQDFFDLFFASWSVIVQLGLKLNPILFGGGRLAPQFFFIAGCF